ncbi:Autophagy protein ATG17-like domain [Dillenia turbinata]|uniref:Autophagy protein ATG17-like domain n=1 Tax=Dillenia turbinata TaxID=194707 RepID=A0AAN8W1H1_9MAGN
MSGNYGEDMPRLGKLLVHVAENGHSFEIECDEITPVEGVQRYMESAAAIPVSDQLLLCSGQKLETHRPLSSYKLPADDQEVFLFNKARLQNNAPPPAPEQIEIIEIADPPLPASSHNPHPLDDASDPALKALPSYERQFRHHYQRGHAIYCRTQVKFEACERLLREQMVQERALDIARGNLDLYYRMIQQMFTDFMKYYLQQHRCHSDLLVNFGRDIEKLRSCKLHPTLQTDNRRCLLDLVKEDNLRKCVESCSNSHRQFETKVARFKEMFAELRSKVEELFSSKASLPIRDTELTIKEHQRYITEQKSIMLSLSKDVSTVKKLVDDCLTCQLSSSLRPHDAVSALGPMYDVHDQNHLPKMQACDRSISNLLNFCKDKKNEMNIFVHNYMQKIAYIQYFIKDVRLQFPVFKEAMMHQDNLFEGLKLVRGIGPAYRACLAEVVRRKASVKLYMGMAGQLAEKLAAKREIEVRRREDFLKAHSSYIPREILESMGLCDTPSQCDVNITPFDTGLLDIDIVDLDHYAPEYLAGLASRSEKQGSSKGSFSAQSDNSQSAEVGDNAADTLEKDESEELLEGCDLIEIAGTSKIEVENAKLKAELASAIALICSLSPEVECESLDDSKLDSILKNAAEKTAEALSLKDEYGKQLESMLRMKQMQCVSYEKRIQELEQRLSDQYMQSQKLSGNKDASDFGLMAAKADECKSEISGNGEHNVPYVSGEPMDEVSCASNSVDMKLGLLPGQQSNAQEGVDESMTELTGMLNPQLDSSMLEPQGEDLHVSVSGKNGKDKIEQPSMALTNSSTAESMPEPQDILPCEAVADVGLVSEVTNDQVLELQNQLAIKMNLLSETESKLKSALDELDVLGRELEVSRKLLDESQMNCAHLENCLHEAREEAQTHLCAADRRASEYSALRASAVKMRGLFERLRTCVNASGGIAAFVDSLHALSQSLSNSMNEKEDDGTAEFRACIKVLVDKVGVLSRQRKELLERYAKVESTNEQLKKELEEKKEMVKTIYTKHQLEKQANKEKISFGRFELHEIAAFFINSAGHYEALSRNSSRYFLSAESVALFTDHLPTQPPYIIGQIVHIEQKIVRAFTPNRVDHGKNDHVDHPPPDMGNNLLTLNLGSSANPFGLPVGCEYFVVTVAMLPNTTIHSVSPS